jgi:hypothetical protein
MLSEGRFRDSDSAQPKNRLVTKNGADENM